MGLNNWSGIKGYHGHSRDWLSLELSVEVFKLFDVIIDNILELLELVVSSVEIFFEVILPLLPVFFDDSLELLPLFIIFVLRLILS